jgi:type IV secretion system protein VirD4
MKFRIDALACRSLLLTSGGLAAVNVLAVALKHPVLAAIPLGVTAYRRFMRYRGTGDAFGTARPSEFSDLVANRQVGGGSGLIVGTAGYTARPTKAEGLLALINPRLDSDVACRMFFSGVLGSHHAAKSIIRIPDGDYVHGAVIAPAGAGKGVGFLIPNALAYRRSLLINDPQGSIYTAAAKRRKRWHRQIRIDTFGICGPGSDAINPLDFLPPPDSPDFLDACRDLASMLIFRQGTEHEPHWNDSAERVLTVFICFVAAVEKNPSLRTLISVRRLIASRETYLATLNAIRTLPGIPPLVKEQAETLSWLTDKELNSVLSVAIRHTGWMASPAVSAVLSHSSFDPLDLKRNKIDVYNIMPPDRLVTLAPLNRVVLGTILRVITRGKPDESNPVLCLIDETAALGRMQVLEDAITQLRAYGIRLFFVFQGVGQIQTLFGNNAQTIQGNLHTQIYVSITDYESCEHLSKLIGDCTIQTTSLNDGTSHSRPTGSPAAGPTPGNAGSSSSVTWSEQGRRWAKPEEIRTSASDLVWAFHKNQPVILAKQLKYFKAREFRWRRTGKDRGLGLAGAVLTAMVVAASLMLSSFVTSPPRPDEPAMSSMPPPLPLGVYDALPPDRGDAGRPRSTGSMDIPPPPLPAGL